MIRANPKSLAKVHELWESRDELDPMHYALGDLLTAYYRLAKVEAHLDSMFGQGASLKLLRRIDPEGYEVPVFAPPNKFGCSHAYCEAPEDVPCAFCDYELAQRND